MGTPLLSMTAIDRPSALPVRSTGTPSASAKPPCVRAARTRCRSTGHRRRASRRAGVPGAGRRAGPGRARDTGAREPGTDDAGDHRHRHGHERREQEPAHGRRASTLDLVEHVQHRAEQRCRRAGKDRESAPVAGAAGRQPAPRQHDGEAGCRQPDDQALDGVDDARDLLVGPGPAGRCRAGRDPRTATTRARAGRPSAAWSARPVGPRAHPAVRESRRGPRRRRRPTGRRSTARR